MQNDGRNRLGELGGSDAALRFWFCFHDKNKNKLSIVSYVEQKLNKVPNFKMVFFVLIKAIKP